MKTSNIFNSLLIILCSISVINLYAQEKADSTKAMHKMDEHSMHKMHHCSSMHNKMHDMIMKDSTHEKMLTKEEDMKKEEKSDLIREGEIDLKAIDENKDGKVFQDQMDWNVISDKPGKCPLCGMKLKEVTLQKAKENLLKHGFKVK